MRRNHCPPPRYHVAIVVIVRRLDQNELETSTCRHRGLQQWSRSDGAQIFCRGLARPSISNNVEGDLLSFVKTMHPGAFDRADVHEDILAAIIRLDKAEAFLAVEPLHGSLRHMTLPSGRCVKKAARQPQPVRSRFGEKSSVRRGVRGEAKSFGRSSMAAMWAIALGSARFAPRVFKRKTCSKWPVME